MIVAGYAVQPKTPISSAATLMLGFLGTSKASVLQLSVHESARAAGIERLYATGALMEDTVASFGAGAQWFADTAALAAALTAALAQAGSEVRLLVKGSRCNRLERVVDALTGVAAGGGGGR